MVKSAVNHYFRSSIGRKQLVAVTGLLLCGFLVSHLAGNLLLIVSSDVFNLYANELFNLGKLLYVIETLLALIFLVHLGLAIKISIENYQSRGKYYMKKRTGRGTTFASMTMPFTGLIILVFLILHLMNLKFGTYYETTIGGIVMRDLTRTTIEYFSSIWAVVWYVFALAATALHTSHGFASAFNTLGWNHGKYYKYIKGTGYIYSIAVGGGFAFVAIYCHLKGA